MAEPDSGKGRGNRNAGIRPWLMWGVSLLAVLFSVVVILVLFEFFVRWQYRDVLSTSHGRDYFYYKSYPLLRTEKNNFRFRGRDIHPRSDATYRVVVMGDSLAWGQGVFPYTDRFPELSEEIFRERYPGKDIEVMNLGVQGSNLRDHLRLLPFVLELDPDFVLYQWYVNDMEDYVDIKQFLAMTLIPKYKWHSWAMDHSVVYLLLYRAWNQLRTGLGLQKSYTAYLAEKLGEPDSPTSLWAQEKLRELLSVLRQKGIAAGIVLFPECKSDMSGYELDFLHDRVLRECELAGIACLDLRRAFAAFDGRMKELRANPLDGHPSRTAHRLAAERIVETFGPVWAEEAAKR